MSHIFLKYIILLIIPLALYSEIIPNSSSLLQQERELKKIPSISEKDILPKQIEEKKKTYKESDITIILKQIKFTGDYEVFTGDYLQNIVKSYINTKVNIKKLYEIKDLIDNEYKKHGYIVVKVFFPKQDITSGNVIIKIIEGRVDSSNDGISLKGETSRLDRNFAQDILINTMKPGSIVNKENLEKALLLISDMPGIHSTVNLEKGTEKNSTKFGFEVIQSDLHNPYLIIDNSGGESTGRYKTTIGDDIKGLSGFGDELKLKYTKSMGRGDLNNISIDYSSYVNSSGLEAGIKGEFITYKLGGDYEDLNLKGESSTYTIYAKYPIIRSNTKSLFFKAAYDIVSLEDKADGSISSLKSQDILRTSLIANHADQFLNGGYSYIDLTYSIGENKIKDNASLESDQGETGANTNGNFSKLELNFSRIQRGSSKIIFILNASGQYTNDNLDSSEKISLGGISGIKSYPTGEASGDIGIKTTLEMQYSLLTDPLFGDIKLLCFYDWGRIRQYTNIRNISLDTPNTYTLSSYGVGINIAKANDYDVNIKFAREEGSNKGADILTGNDSDGTDHDNRVWFTVRKDF